MIRNKWDNIIINVLLTAKISAYTEEQSNTISAARHLKARHYLANTKTAEVKVLQVPQNRCHCNLLL